MLAVGVMGVTVGKGVWAFPTFDGGIVLGVGERSGADGKLVGLVLPWHSEAVTVTVETISKVTVLAPKVFGVVTGAPSDAPRAKCLRWDNGARSKLSTIHLVVSGPISQVCGHYSACRNCT